MFSSAPTTNPSGISLGAPAPSFVIVRAEATDAPSPQTGAGLNLQSEEDLWFSSPTTYVSKEFDQECLIPSIGRNGCRMKHFVYCSPNPFPHHRAVQNASRQKIGRPHRRVNTGVCAPCCLMRMRAERNARSLSHLHPFRCFSHLSAAL